MAHSKYIKKGIFLPINPNKYVGNVHKIIYRSSWELKVFQWCDLQTSVLQWNSEELKIPYYDSVKAKQRTYYPDVIAVIKTKTGEKKFVIEVKPHHESVLPKKTKRMKKETYNKKMVTYINNQEKWDSARAWCTEHGFEFVILTEYELGLK